MAQLDDLQNDNDLDINEWIDQWREIRPPG